MTWINLILFASSAVLPQKPAYDLNRDANDLLEQGRYAQALGPARAAVEAARTTFGAEHPATAMMLRNLAVAYERTGDYLHARESAERSLAILESSFGLRDVSLVPVLNVLTEVYASEGRLGAARGAALRSVAIGSDAGVHYATALHNAGAVFEREGRLAEAARFYSRALEARESMLPRGHAYTETTRAALERVERARELAARTLPSSQPVSALVP